MTSPPFLGFLFFAAVSAARHPQLLVLPDLSAPECVTVLPPQSQTHSQNLRERPSEYLNSTVTSFPYLSPAFVSRSTSISTQRLILGRK